MHAVRAEPFGQAHIVVHDEGDVARCADFLQRRCKPGGFVLVDALHPELEGRDRPRVQRRLERLRKGAGHVERRDQIELAGGPARIALELLGEIGGQSGELVLVHHARASRTRFTAAMKPAGSSRRWATAGIGRRPGKGGSRSSMTLG